MSNKKIESWLEAQADNIDDWLLEGLKVATEYLGMSTGIVSQIDGDQYTIKSVYSILGDVFKPGMSFELKHTYCEAVVRSHKTVTYIHVGSIPTMVLHPVYTAVQLESYIGVPLYDKDKNIVGTLNFSSHEVRPEKFTDEEINLIEKMANKISSVID